MSSKAKMVQEVKKDIRSLLISAQRGLTSTMLLDDYKQFIGHPLPFRELGYNAPIDFIRDINDVVQITWQGSMMVLRAVVDEDTQRVASLVAKQRESRPRRLYERRSQPRPRPLLPAPTVPAGIRTQVKQLLASYPSGIPSSAFNTAFGRRFGSQINYTKLGYKSMGELLRALRDIILIRPQAGNTFRIYGRGAPTSTVPAVNAQGPHQGAILVERVKSPTLTEYELVKPHRSTEQPRPSTEQPRPSTEQPKPTTEQPKPTTEQPKPTTEQPKPTPKPTPKPEPASCGVIDPVLKEEITQVLAERPNGMWAKRLPFEYKRQLGKELPLQENGFYSVIEMISALTDVAVITRPNPNGDWWLCEQKAFRRKEEEKVSAPAASPPSLELLVVQVLQTHPEGIKSKQFPDVFKTLTGRTLPVAEQGYKSTETLLLDMPDYVRMVYKGPGTVMLYAREDALKKLQPQEKPAPKEEEQPKPRVKRDDHEGIPIDAVGSGVFYPQLPLPEPTVDEPLYIEVYICNVVDPGNFHVQFRGQQTADALEELMDKLEKVYCSDESRRYKMRPDLIAMGQACVAMFPEDENWHRAMITAIPSLDFVTVSFVDYGTIASVPKSALRMLKAEFLHLPIQAVNARLANIQPNSLDKQWTSAARDRLLTLTRDKPLVALVTHLDVQSKTLSLCPCDTTTEQDIHINDTLVSEGHAILCPDVDLWSLSAEAPNTDITSAGASSQSVNHTSDVPPSTNQGPGGVSQLQDLQDVVMPGMIGSIYPSLFPTFPDLSQGPFSQSAHLDMSCLSDRREAAGEDQPESGQENSRQDDTVFMQEVCQELEQEEEPPKPRLIKQVQLTDEHHISIIKYQDKPYVISGEISAFFWDSDLLRSMLRQKKLVMPKEVVTMDLCPELFEELQRLQVTGIYDGGSLRTHLTIYELQCVPDILLAFEDSSLELADRIQEELQSFDPEDPYWKGIDLPDEESQEDEDEEEEEDSDEYEFTLDQLRLTLQTLQIRRQRILHEMVNSPGASSVDELNTVELQMTDVRNRIKHKEQEETEDESSSSFRPLGFQASTHDEVIQRCVDQQYQSQTRGQADTDTGGHTDMAGKGTQAREESEPAKTGVKWSSWKEVDTSKKEEESPQKQGVTPQACIIQPTEKEAVVSSKKAEEVTTTRQPTISVSGQKVQAPANNAASHPVVAVKPQQGREGSVQRGETAVRSPPAPPPHPPAMSPYMQQPSEQLPGMYQQQPVQYTVTATAQYYQQCNPQQYNPQQYNPQQYNPQQYTPQQYTPQQYTPQQYPPQQYPPQHLFMNQHPPRSTQGMYVSPDMQVQPYHRMMFQYNNGNMYGVGGQVPLGQGRGQNMYNNFR
ncbi:tudor domain-containing protein 5-like isoform X2 [Branchiostoma lanceolatum]|uniref:tudor domain-containing protein 5-like isoform X2 n=1 Tax=Branchiostoma lanceolatum TaxID=7740 RepID=UPI0034564133